MKHFNRTNPNDCQQLFEIYKPFAIVGPRTSEQIIQDCSERYGLPPVSGLEGVDYFARRQLSMFQNMMSDHPSNDLSEFLTDQVELGSFRLYRLPRNEKTELYYQDFLKHTWFEVNGQPNQIYLYHETQKDKFFSNCYCFSLELEILRGITEEDIQQETPTYKWHAHMLYDYHEWIDSKKNA